MYKKGIAVEIQFSPDRLSRRDSGDCKIALSDTEARELFARLAQRIAVEGASSAPSVVSLDTPSEHVRDAAPSAPRVRQSREFRQWVCVICGWIYDEEAGCPEEGIAPGTLFADIPDGWRCPLCDVGKEDFAVVEF
jgi:rubredoxin